MDRVVPIREHVLMALPAYGAVWDEVDDGLFVALLPEELAARLDVPPDLWRFTFDPEVQAEEDGVELLVFGNPALDRLLEFGCACAVSAEVHVTGLYVDDPRIAGSVKRAFKVDGAELTVGETRVRNVRFVRFTFHASFVTDVREEHLRSVSVDLTTGELARQWVTALDEAALGSAPTSVRPDAPTIGFAEAYTIGRAEVLAQLTSTYGRLRRDLDHRRRDEARRITNFHDGYREEQEALKTRYRNQPERAAALDAKIEASRIERERRIRDLPAKYALSVSVCLRGALTIVQPMVFAECALVRDGAKLGCFTARWDPRERRVDPAPCPACGKLSFVFAVNRRPRAAYPIQCEWCSAATAAAR